MYTIYLIEDHRNKPYVGMTSKSFEKRFRRHKVIARGESESHLHRAMRKYGVVKFKVIPLDTAPTYKNACELEKQWIDRLGTFKDWGYNMTPGGDGAEDGKGNPMYGEELSEEHKRKIGKAVSGEDNPMYGEEREHSDKAKRKMSESTSGENHPRYWDGKEHSEETKQKISDANRVLSDEEAIEAVVEYRTTDKFQREVAEDYGMSQTAISNFHTGDERPYLQEKIESCISER